jgi:hypothetical protein
VNDAITIHLQDEGSAFTRGTANRGELLVPLLLPNGEYKLEVDYVW